MQPYRTLSVQGCEKQAFATEQTGAKAAIEGDIEFGTECRAQKGVFLAGDLLADTLWHFMGIPP